MIKASACLAFSCQFTLSWGPYYSSHLPASGTAQHCQMLIFGSPGRAVPRCHYPRACYATRRAAGTLGPPDVSSSSPYPRTRATCSPCWAWQCSRWVSNASSCSSTLASFSSSPSSPPHSFFSIPFCIRRLSIISPPVNSLFKSLSRSAPLLHLLYSQSCFTSSFASTPTISRSPPPTVNLVLLLLAFAFLPLEEHLKAPDSLT